MKALLLAFLLFSMGAALGQSLSKEQTDRINFEQHISSRVPLNATFRDEAGNPVRLGTFFGQRPVVLVLAYYGCPNLCTVVLNGMLESVRNLRQDAGRVFEIVIVSIDPHESAALAQEKKQTYVRRYGRPGAANGWHFLTGDEPSIQQLCTAAGYHYFYDPVSKQYAHPSGIVVLTPGGDISRYFFGIEYPPKELNQALVDAAQNKAGSLVDRLLLLCFHYDPNTGRYTLFIKRLLQLGGIGTVAALAGLILVMGRKKRAAGSSVPASPSALAALPFLPEPATEIAGSVDEIFWSMVVVCGAVTLALFVTITYFCIRYRAGSPAKRPPDGKQSILLEVVWSSITLIVFTAIFIWAAVVYFRMSEPPANASEIYVVAKQWMWKVQHPNGRSEINELHLQVNQPVKLIMTSQDVIHDFFVPAFRTKQDVLPDRYTSEWFTPIRPGKYPLYCAEYCGGDHSRMKGWVYVQQPAEHARWLAELSNGETLTSAGQRLFVARGCSGCHSPQSQVRSPLLTGIYRRPVALSDGTTVIANDQYLHDSILLPNKQITAGYEPKMPTFQGQISEEEIMQLIAYIKSLGTQQGGTP
jgi:cytochrome c oxidase subunit II